MGLDMYLSKKTYVKNWEHQSDAEKHKITVKLGGKVRKDIKPERICYIVEEVGYWRKFNALHNWIVENCAEGVDDCKEVYIEPSKLNLLLDNLKKVKASLDKSGKKELSGGNGYKVFTDTAIAEELLPTQSGFFFGATVYDEWYYNDVVMTIKLLKELLGNVEEDSSDYYYRASW